MSVVAGGSRAAEAHGAVDRMAEEKREKLFRILFGLIEPRAHISNDCYLEMLITHLSGKCKSPGRGGASMWSRIRTQSSDFLADKDIREILKSPRLLEWIEKAVAGWEAGQCPEAHVMAFTIRLTALVIENEWQFSLVKERQLLERCDRFVPRL